MRAVVAETGPVADGLRVREIDDDEGRRLLRIVRRGSLRAHSRVTTYPLKKVRLD
jgi:hypothetical protein